MNNVKTLRSIDLDTDHEFLSADLKLKFKNKKKENKKSRFKTSTLKISATKDMFIQALSKDLEPLIASEKTVPLLCQKGTKIIRSITVTTIGMKEKSTPVGYNLLSWISGMEKEDLKIP